MQDLQLAEEVQPRHSPEQAMQVVVLASKKEVALQATHMEFCNTEPGWQAMQELGLKEVQVVQKVSAQQLILFRQLVGQAGGQLMHFRVVAEYTSETAQGDMQVPEPGQ